eukprot:1964085-Pleurochrysis_carterae.AAC.3
MRGGSERALRTTYEARRALCLGLPCCAFQLRRMRRFATSDAETCARSHGSSASTGQRTTRPGDDASLR